MSNASLLNFNRLAGTTLFVMALVALAYSLAPVFDASFYDEYRDNDRYSWLFYRFKDESGFDAYQSAIINLGWFEIPSLAIFYVG